jgi:hypothetical protein
VTQPSDSELQQMARRLLGRDIDEADGAVLRSHLRNMARVKALLGDWGDRLGETEPVTIYRVPAPAEDGRGGR